MMLWSVGSTMYEEGHLWTPRTRKVMAREGGGWAGAWAGGEIGMWTGGYVGGPVGAIPGGALGAVLGSFFGTQASDTLMGQSNQNTQLAHSSEATEED